MPDDDIKNGEGSGLNRRNFLKSAGVVVTGTTLAAGMTLAPTAAEAAEAAEKAAEKKGRRLRRK